MSLENLIRMQSSGARGIEEPNTPRPGGVPQGTVLVMLDVTKDVGTAAVYWALGNVVRRGDNFKIVGIVTHTCNPMGFRTRVDKNSWLGSNGLLLQHDLTVKRNALENVPHVKEWCEKAGVNLELDVKAGYITKLIIVDEAKAVGAYHVVLDKSMKGDRKYFIEHLTCFVSRARQSGGVETIRSFSVTKQLPPLVPTSSRDRFTGGNQINASPRSTMSMASLVSYGTSRGSASSGSFGVASSDGFHTQSSDTFSGAPTTSDSLELGQEIQEVGPPLPLPVRALQSDANSMVSRKSDTVAGMGRHSVSETVEMGYNLVNRKPALRKWLTEDEPAADMLPYEHSITDSFNDRSSNGNGNKILAPLESEQQLRRLSPPATMEKILHVAAPSPLLQTSPGQMFAPVRLPSHLTALPPVPAQRMLSPPTSKLSQSSQKTVWIWTRSKDVMRSAVELGWTTFIFTPDTKDMAPQWASIEWIRPLFLEGGRFLNREGKQVALLGQVYSGEQLDYLPAMMGGAEVVVINDLDWQVIPPEEVVAAFQGRRTRLLATANTAADAQVYLEALGVGTSGVVLHTDNCAEITALKDYLTAKGEKPVAVEAPINELKLEPAAFARSEPNGLPRVGSSPRSDTNPLKRIGSSPRLADSPRNSGSSHQSFPPQEHHGLRLINATVKSVVSVGEGDRVSVDLCNLLNPGEALLVGSFSRGMFLVHSEVSDTNTSRRSFRVNAGPVHAYTGMAGGHITYLSELESGSHIVAVDAHGNHRTVLVGRVSIESKPLVLVHVEAEGEVFSVMLQDADFVRLVVPAANQRPGFEAIAVTKLQPGDVVLLSLEDDDNSFEQ